MAYRSLVPRVQLSRYEAVLVLIGVVSYVFGAVLGFDRSKDGLGAAAYSAVFGGFAGLVLAAIATALVAAGFYGITSLLRGRSAR